VQRAARGVNASVEKNFFALLRRENFLRALLSCKLFVSGD
jgi:hypothetical protein